MEPIMLIYKSATGFTKQYAQWIAEQTPCTLFEFREGTAKEMSRYDTIVFGSRAHAGRIDGLPKIRERFQKSGAHRLVLFVTGAMPATASDTIAAFWEQNLTKDELMSIPHFYMPGGLRYERMSFGDRLMMKAAAAMMKKKKEKSAQDLEFERAIASSYDISSREYTKPLISLLNPPAPLAGRPTGSESK